MKLMLGLIVVIGCVLGGYVLHHGHLILLFIPTEYLIIVGCAVVLMIIHNPTRVLIRLINDLFGQFCVSVPGNSQYLEILKIYYHLIHLSRYYSVLALSDHVTYPSDSVFISI